MSKNNNKNKKIYPHTFSVQLSITQSLCSFCCSCCCCYCVILLLQHQQNYTLKTTTRTKRLIYIHFLFNNAIEEADYHQTYLAQMYPTVVEASSGQKQYYIRCQVSLTFSGTAIEEADYNQTYLAQMYPLPPVEASSGQYWYSSIMGSNGFTCSFHVRAIGEVSYTL